MNIGDHVYVIPDSVSTNPVAFTAATVLGINEPDGECWIQWESGKDEIRLIRDCLDATDQMGAAERTRMQELEKAAYHQGIANALSVWQGNPPTSTVEQLQAEIDELKKQQAGMAMFVDAMKVHIGENARNAENQSSALANYLAGRG